MAVYDNKIPNNLSKQNVLIYIMPQKIQKRRLEDMKIGAKKKGIQISPNYCSSVTHVVSEFTNLEQVLRILEVKTEAEIKDQHIVKTVWFIESIKAGYPVSVEIQHKIQLIKPREEEKNVEPVIPEWACQRATPFKHFNEQFTEPLEILEKYAELRDQEQDYSRALAFRRASCVLKSLPYKVTNISSLKNIKDIGGHSSRVIKEILEDGYCQEVEDIVNDPWFHKMKLFSSIFGVGPSTAKKWIEKGWNNLKDINIEDLRNDWRVIWGVAFHEELMDSVSRTEADVFAQIVCEEAEKILPGVCVVLTGGFRRGKPIGHDVDLLLTHPDLGSETGLLATLLQRLEEKELILCGNHERSSFSPEVYQRDFKLSMRGQLDHFEKWLGICKFPKTFIEGCSDILTKINVATKSVIKGSLDDCEEPKVKLRKLTSKTLSPVDIFKSTRDWKARRVDLIISPYDQYYYALVGWTGNKHFNRDLRLYSQRVLNMKLTSHGLYDLSKNVTVPASSEKEVFENLNLTFREPSDRNC
ncbi:DNA-directed DNA/RNA polymerase mu [Patella vulgata]|uniref:DNA-directed DNA/RNA polymerase mu n=1 Tax=Patella vulgata TaxID=6465 RepID=UPI0021801592|nr:DNA-directed DNA/RNA polymerase mu [Patella vulgata]